MSRELSPLREIFMSCSQRFGSLVTEALAYQRHLVLQLDAELLSHAALRFCFQRRDVGCRGAAGVNKEVAVLVGELRAADLVAAHADAIDQLPGRVLGRILEERARRCGRAAGP